MTPNNAGFSQQFIVVNADGSPYVLTGHDLQMDIKNAPGEDPIASFSTEDGELVIIESDDENVFMIVLDDAQMSEIVAGRYWFDVLDVTDADTSINFGGGYWDVGSGITNNDTTSLPSAQVCFSSSMRLVVGNPPITMTLLPSGPPGPIGQYDVAEPLTFPTVGWKVLWDIADGQLKATYQDGITIVRLAIPGS